mmetsp:Transcript_25953/g.68066  ORF Transcript_25953/g.68066 Transcript_25953/m.68066 type:complete len:81 (+) Transcript_25953:164-406(+)
MVCLDHLGRDRRACDTNWLKCSVEQLCLVYSLFNLGGSAWGSGIPPHDARRYPFLRSSDNHKKLTEHPPQDASLKTSSQN